MQIISFNVNGIRACIKKGFIDFINNQDPDIFCLQETKINEGFLVDELPNYKYRYNNFAQKKGYSGVCIFAKQEPLNISYGIDTLDVSNDEGRVISVEYKDFYLVNVYTPNTKPDLARLDYRLKWDDKFLEYLQGLNKKNNVILCGDLNVAHEPIDLKNDKANMGKNGFTKEERQGFSNYMQNGFVDTFRHLYPDTVKYSWWSYMGNARKNNSGWRIDYFLTNNEFIDKIKDSFILNEVYGSDHCPVGITLK